MMANARGNSESAAAAAAGASAVEEAARPAAAFSHVPLSGANGGANSSANSSANKESPTTPSPPHPQSASKWLSTLLQSHILNRTTISPEFHLLPSLKPSLSSSASSEKNLKNELFHSIWRFRLGSASDSVEKSDIVTLNNEYNYRNEGDVDELENSAVSPSGRNQRSAAAGTATGTAGAGQGVAGMELELGSGELDESTVRNERSTNLSHITGTARKIQMYVKNRHLQILPDGTVNGTSDESSDFTILQRASVNTGELQIQGVATCLFLCMDVCGLLYGAMQFTDECIFRENIEQDHYNTYSSVHFSNTRKTLYLALDGRGASRKVQVTAARQKRQQMLQLAGVGNPKGGSLGKLSTYARVLTRHVHQTRVEELARRLLLERQREITNSSGETEHGLRHHGYSHLCPTQPAKPAPALRPAVPNRCPKRAPLPNKGGATPTNPNNKKNKGQANKRNKRKQKCKDMEDPEKCKRLRNNRKKNVKRKPPAGKNTKLARRRTTTTSSSTTTTTTTTTTPNSVTE